MKIWVRAELALLQGCSEFCFMIVKAYHGTTEIVANGLVSGALTWKPSQNEGDWLGFGSYFFEGGPYRAFHWARSNLGAGEPVKVVEAELDLSDCLDLLDISDFQVLKTQAQIAAGAVSIPAQDPLEVSNGRARPPKGVPLKMRNRWDRFVVDFCVASLFDSRRITSVRSAFLWGHAVSNASFLFNWSRVEIAVREPAAVIRSVRLWSGA